MRVFVQLVTQGVQGLQINLVGEELQPQKLQLNQTCAQFAQQVEQLQANFSSMAGLNLMAEPVPDAMQQGMRQQVHSQWILPKWKEEQKKKTEKQTAANSKAGCGG